MLNRNIAQPLHLQLENDLRERLANGEWAVDTCIASENALGEEYGVSRMTVRAVLNRLVEAGLIYRVPGKGTFVSEPKIIGAPLSQMGIIKQLESMGYDVLTKIIEIKQTGAPSNIRKILDIKKSDQVNVVQRVRYVREQPLSYHTSYIPVPIFGVLEKEDLEGIQIWDYLEQVGHCEVVKRVETLESITADESVAKHLGVKVGFPLLVLENRVYTHNDQIVEFSQVQFRGDKIKINLSYEK